MKTALLIIDVQHALCSGEHQAFEFEHVIERINQVARKARQANMPVLVIQHESKTGPLEHGSDGWQLEHALEVFATDTFIRKTATDSFHKTDLQAILAQQSVEQLIICGLQSEFCVDTTTRRALALGYPIILVADGHSTKSNNTLTAQQISSHHNETLANIGSFGVRVRAIPAAQVFL